MTMAQRKAFFDKLVEKTVSRKLMVWVASSSFLAFGMITADHWVQISLAYVGLQGFADMAASYRNGTAKKEE